MNENLTFGYWVRRRRKALDLTQVTLGGQVGASAAMIRKIEADERRPSRELAELLAVALAVPEAEREAFLSAGRGWVGERAPQLSSSLLPAPANFPPSNLPAPLTSMVNRVNDLAAVSALLLRRDVRLVTVLGPPGIGKTRLSIQTVENLLPHFYDGVWFVDLSPITEPDRVLPTIAMALGLPPAPGLSPAVHVQTGVGHRQMLLVLDNFEQVVEGAAKDVAGLLRACRRLKVLVTSRVRLEIYGEYEYHLPPMSCPPSAESYDPEQLLTYEAVQLFLDRARQHRHDFALTAETAAPIVDICRRMEGLPLALELAAARTRRMSVDELALALRQASGRDWHALLAITARDLPPRQRTLFNAIAWSYNLLAPEEKAIFRKLGVFAGHFDVAAAEAVCRRPAESDQVDVRAIIERLVDHNLVTLQSRRPARWRLLEMTREFAFAEMDSAEVQAAKRDHARHFATRHFGWYANWIDPAYLDAIEDDLDNYLVALRYTIEIVDAATASYLGAALGRFWERRGLLDEGRVLLAQVMALPGEVDPKARFAVIHEATILAWMQHDFATAEVLAAQAMNLARGQGNLASVSVVLNLLGRIYLEQGRYEDADHVLSESIHPDQNLTPRDSAGMQIIQRGEAALALGSLEQAESLTLAGLASITESDLIPYCLGWNNLAEVALVRGDVAAARAALGRVLPLAHLHFRRMRIFLIAVAGQALAADTVRPGDLSAATKLLSYVMAANERMGDPLSPMTQRLLAARVATARQRLALEKWRVAWAVGQRWTVEQALVEARRMLTDSL